ncbi:MAG TPA: LytTR family DNA-binding domain-containing protein [Flavilitoribacter sp.]|nr:LytTR family DNA-binding domain-containing protein [Flavilitoribacter sp.]HMQ90148.1 LytTR family DNA-binding domain-containing protein [Flavilitoribacter sp.]
MKLRCVIADDEPLACEGLARHIEVVDYLELIGIVQNPVELDQLMETETPDLIFLDIEMPFMTGIDFLKLKSALPPVILTTAYPNYALEAFQFDVVDYLLKPITFNRFFKAVKKARELQFLKDQKKTSGTVQPEPDYFFIKCEGKYEKIRTDEILFVQSLQNYVMIRTETGKYMTLMSLKTLEENLDPVQFIRVHKSYIVSVSKINSFEQTEIRIGDELVPISRSNKEWVHEKILSNKYFFK